MAEGISQYLDAFNSGFKSSVDVFNYPVQQKAATELAQANVELTKQNIKSNDLTFQEKLLQLEGTKRMQKQDEEIAAQLKQMFPTSDNTAEIDVNNFQQESNFLQRQKAEADLLSQMPGRRKEAGEMYKHIAEQENKVADTRSKAAKAFTERLTSQANAASAVNSQESLIQLGAQLESSGAKPFDWPKVWDQKAKNYMNSLANAASSALDKQKFADEQLKTQATIKKDAANTAESYARITHMKNQDALARDRLEIDKRPLSEFGGMSQAKAIALANYSQRRVEDHAKQVKLAENLSIVRDVNSTFLDDKGRVKPITTRTPADVESLLWAYIQVNKPERMGSARMVDQMNSDLASLPVRIGNKVVTVLAGKRLDPVTIQALVKNINEKVSSRNEEVKRIEDMQIKRLKNMGWGDDEARNAAGGYADRSNETPPPPAATGSFATASPQIKKFVNEQMKKHNIQDAEVAYQLLKDKGAF